MLSSFQVFGDCVTYLLLISNLILLVRERTSGILILLNPLFSSPGDGMSYVLCALEKNILLSVGRMVYKYLLESGWLTVLSSISLLIFCLMVLLILERKMLKSQTITADLPASFSSTRFCCIFFAAPLSGIRTPGVMSSR